MKTYPQVLGELFARAGSKFKLGLENIITIEEALSHPEKKMGRVILVAGTNGKGSTATFLSEILQAHGFNVGLFTSPHLLRFTERAKVNGVEISQEDVVRHFQEIQKAEESSGTKISFFEAAALISFLSFAEHNVDFAVLEVGLGGRLDATNSVPHELALLTPIAKDHQKTLGATLSAIAGEKAAVIPSGQSALSAPQKPSVEVVFKEFAEKRNTNLSFLETKDIPGQSDSHQIISTSGALPAYQRMNLGLAIKAATHLLGDLREDSLDHAIRSFRWPGRYEWFDAPFPTLLDGAHNLAGMKTFVVAIQKDARLKNKPLHLVYGGLKDKNHREMLSLLRPHLATLYLCEVDSPRSLSANALRELEPKSEIFLSPLAALHAAHRKTQANGGVTVVCGSLYAIGPALGFLCKEESDPEWKGVKD
ncbi:hypothetical protein KAI87_14915 [Myxococcota bacterium]|nr:hypothetical protein [Myxococcota bacterium]